MLGPVALLLTTALAAAPPPTKPPPVGDAATRAEALVRAIRTGDAAQAAAFFFPRAAFRKVKGIADPDKYFDYLIAVYAEDIATIRASLSEPDSIELVRFDLGRWKRWVERGKEANALPYHAAHKSPLVIRDAGVEKTLKVRVMITWDGQWYVTHLLRKRRGEKPDKRLMPR